MSCIKYNKVKAGEYHKIINPVNQILINQM